MLFFIVSSSPFPKQPEIDDDELQPQILASLLES